MIEFLPARNSTHLLLDRLTRCRCGRETYWLVNCLGRTYCPACRPEKETI